MSDIDPLAKAWNRGERWAAMLTELEAARFHLGEAEDGSDVLSEATQRNLWAIREATENLLNAVMDEREKAYGARATL